MTETKPVQAESGEIVTDRQRLPVLPLRETVVFPGVTAPIVAGRDKTLRAIEQALKGGEESKRIFAVAQRENEDEPVPEVLYDIGVICQIAQIQRFPGGLQLLLECEPPVTLMRPKTTMAPDDSRSLTAVLAGNRQAGALPTWHARCIIFETPLQAGPLARGRQARPRRGFPLDDPAPRGSFAGGRKPSCSMDRSYGCGGQVPRGQTAPRRS